MELSIINIGDIIIKIFEVGQAKPVQTDSTECADRSGCILVAKAYSSVNKCHYEQIVQILC